MYVLGIDDLHDIVTANKWSGHVIICLYYDGGQERKRNKTPKHLKSTIQPSRKSDSKDQWRQVFLFSRSTYKPV